MDEHGIASAPAAARSDDELLDAADRVAQLLEDVRGMAGPSAWQRVEEVVQRLLELYGAGLERILAHAAAVEAAPGALAARLREDALVSSLLLLHGLHPVASDERVARALDDVRRRLDGYELQLLAIEPDGTVRLRARADPGACPSTSDAVARAIERHILEAAPEVRRVELEGLAVSPPAPASREPLVQLRPPRDGAAG